MPAASYDARTSHRDLASELERLRIQAVASWRKERRLIESFGLRDGMAVLEVGCGPGFVTECLLESFPTTTVTAVEVDPLLAATARERLSSFADRRLHVSTGSILDSGLPAATFDFAIARLVFQHLSETVAAAEEIKQLLRPGGILVIIDSDDDLWGLADPPFREISAILGAYGKAQAECGGNRNIGRQLLRVLDAAGFVDRRVEAILNHSDELGLDALLPHFDPDRLAPLVASGTLQSTTLAGFRSAIDNFTAAQRPLLMMLLILAAGRKP